ncbi:polysaccharide pyruvyl transferase [Haloactinopolyspora alba]|uniref:Polysaccharide pyruvyl transferase n=1 Tax=Haloactinopolyspora alba TaxID=648780 RepID=A0A2P8E5K4_9ACTN|nr:polysaccharide pyruvyl transferase family protein [Haloactinopolyspora alba]PSL04731.1 polysaccharide pyruvyl transferase [Haloactinopolyspora alba]
MTAFDDGWGVRPDASGRYASTEVEFAGVRMSRRWYRPESWAQVRAAQSVGTRLLRGRGNPVAARIGRADAVLDVSGGDSFTDMYGPTRLRSVSAPKRAAIRAGRTLVLLPQTYGPFDTSEGHALAARLVRSARLAYARDLDSHQRLLELAGPDADTSRLRDGVDVAFALRPRRPAGSVADKVEAVAADGVLAGVNISGLLRGAHAVERFGLAGDYVGTMSALLEELVDAGAHVLAVPHVHVPGGGGESDVAAIGQALDQLPDTARSRVTVLPPELDAAELKWCIAQCAWFAGSRMHSTIGALSSRVPAFGYAYSDKTRGVFDTCGAADQVLEARRCAGPAAVEAMVTSFHDRESIRRELAVRVPPVVDRSRDQLTELLSDVRRWRDGADEWEAIA